MKNKRPRISRVAIYDFALVCLIFVSNIAFAANMRYEAVDLGTLPGGQESGVNSINESREAVGYAYDSSQKYHAVLYRQGQVVDLGALPGDEESAAYSINDKHQVVGYSVKSDGGIHAFLYSDGVMQDLGVPEGANYSDASAINEKGEIVGTAGFGATTRGVIYSKGRWHLGEKNIPYSAINDRGLVGGSYLDKGKFIYGFYKQGKAHYAGLTDGKLTLRLVKDINNRNQLAGGGYVLANLPGSNGASQPVFQDRAVVYDVPKREFRDLGALPARPGVIAGAQASSINERDMAVGFAQNRLLKPDGSFVYRRAKAVLFSSGKVYDLNKRLKNHFDLHLEFANDINEHGDIAAEGLTKEGITRAVVLLRVK